MWCGLETYGLKNCDFVNQPATGVMAVEKKGQSGAFLR